MAKTVDISMDSFKELLDKIEDFFLDLKDKFMDLDIFQQSAWGAVALGFILVIVGVIVW